MDLKSLTIERSPRSAKRRGGSPWPLRLALAGLVAAAGWLFWPALSGYSDRLRLPEVRAFVVAAAAPAAAAAVRGTAANGYVIAERRAALSSDVPGRIVEMRVKEGSVVARGDVVARLYSDEYAAALQRAEADLATAVANVGRAEANLLAAHAAVAEAEAAVATTGAQRAEALADRAWAISERERTARLLAEGAGSQRDVTRAATECEAAEARVAAAAARQDASERARDSATQRLAVATADVAVAEAQRTAAEAARVLAQATLDKTFVRAPFDGIVVLKDAEVGEVVSPNSQGGSTARGAVCTMVDLASLEVQANVPETTLASVRLGAPADVFLDAFPDDRYEGVVDRIWPTADRQKATVEVRVRLVRRDDRLRPEMGVRIVFRDAAAPTADPSADPAADRRAAILVPEAAIVEIDGRSGAFVLSRDVATFAEVTAGERKAGRVAIDRGLVAGQRIVLDPPASLRSGDRVRIAGQ